MGDQTKRLTFVATPEVEAQMKDLKREVYFDRSQSEMIRDLMAAGMRASEVTAASGKEKRNHA